jgi:3-dehydroquinate dehydratase-1
MRPCITPPLLIRGAEFGGPKPLFCVPLVARDLNQLLTQAEVAHRLEPDVVEWRVDSYGELSAESVVEAARQLRLVLDREPIVFTLRIAAEGGASPISQDLRAHCMGAVLRSGLIDLVDVELCNGTQFLEPVIAAAHRHAAHVILSFHDFQATPSNEILLARISEMVRQGADIAKIACMPREPGDVLRLLQVTLAARQIFPAVPLCTMSMGSLGSLSRVAGFLYGSDMAFAVGQEVSAPGQIPIGEARAMTEALLRYA